MNDQPVLFLSGSQIYISGWKRWLGCLLPVALCMGITTLAKIAAFLM